MSRPRGELLDALRRTARTWRGAARTPVAGAVAARVPARAARSWPERFERNHPYVPTPDNRPSPLDCGPLPLTRDCVSQMSFGERAALEGVLAELSPRVAVEIGSAEGGNLRRMAAHCQRLYSLDLDHGPLGDDVPSNVSLLTGDSAATLPKLLRSLEADRQVIDLALVDGDHSYEGVRRDLRNLLESPCTSRSAILVHDSMNEEVRAGVESLSLEDYPAVVYYELDFIAGYVYRTGVARNSAWGGLAMVLTDQARCGRYASSPRQDLYHEPFFALQRMRSEQAP